MSMKRFSYTCQESHIITSVHSFHVGNEDIYKFIQFAAWINLVMFVYLIIPIGMPQIQKCCSAPLGVFGLTSEDG